LNELLKVFGSKMILEIFLGVFSLIFVYCMYIKFVKWTYFEKLGVVQMPTSLPFGNFNEMLTQVTVPFIFSNKNALLRSIYDWREELLV
jgi:hypothetical protein